MENRRLIVVCNLKPRNLVGFKSYGMVLCAVNEQGKVEFLDPPPESNVGDRITGLGLSGEPLTSSQCDKQKAFDVVAPGLRVDGSGVAFWNEFQLVDPAGRPCISPSIRNGRIS